MDANPTVVQEYLERGGSWGELKLRCALEATAGTRTPSAECRRASSRRLTACHSVSTAFKKQREVKDDEVVHTRLDTRRKSIQEHTTVAANERVAMARREAARAERKASSKYSKTDILLLKGVFDGYDKDGNGLIELTELWSALRRQREHVQRHDGRRRSLAERQAAAGVVTGNRLQRKAGAGNVFLSSQALPLFNAMDRDGDGTVTFRELLACLYPHVAPGELETMLGWVAPIEPPPPTESGPRASAAGRAEIAKLFDLYDADGSGGITVAELHAALSASCALDDGEVARMFATFDADCNCAIDRDEFVALMASTAAFSDFDD